MLTLKKSPFILGSQVNDFYIIDRNASCTSCDNPVKPLGPEIKVPINVNESLGKVDAAAAV